MLFTFVLFSYRSFFSKHLALFSAYVSITNNLKLTTASLTMKPRKSIFHISSYTLLQNIFIDNNKILHWQEKTRSCAFSFLMVFNVYLPAGAMIETIEFNKVFTIEKVWHDIQHCVLLHVATNLLCLKLRERSTPQRHI